MKNIFGNHIKGKKWVRYFLAALLIFVLALTGCGAAQGSLEDEGQAAGQTADEDFGEPGNGAAEDETEALWEEDSEGPANDSAAAIEEESGEPAEDGTYTSKDDVARYIYIYGHLPSNFITKKEANDLGWQGGSLEPYAPGKCIGGSRFGNYEGLLPEKEGRVYTECDIDTLGADKRGSKRIVFSNDGLIYYTGDHYESFELLYGDD